MKFDLDYIAHNNKLFLVNPYYKLFFSLILMIVTLCYNNLYFDVLIFLLMVVLIIVIAGVSVKSYLKFITIPFIFAFVTCLYLALFTGGGTPIWDTGFFGIIITRNSYNLAIETFFRVFACFSCLGFLAFTTPIAEILHCLGEMKMPKVMIEIALLMYNTIFIFANEVDIMKNAQETRLGYRNSKSTYHSLASLFTNLFIITFDKSEKLQNALDSRGYTGEIPIYKPKRKK